MPSSAGRKSASRAHRDCHRCPAATAPSRPSVSAAPRAEWIPRRELAEGLLPGQARHGCARLPPHDTGQHGVCAARGPAHLGRGGCSRPSSPITRRHTAGCVPASKPWTCSMCRRDRCTRFIPSTSRTRLTTLPPAAPAGRVRHRDWRRPRPLCREGLAHRPDGARCDDAQRRDGAGRTALRAGALNPQAPGPQYAHRLHRLVRAGHNRCRHNLACSRGPCA
jgi:hypothetical protein